MEKDTQVGFRCKQELQDWLEAKADADDRSVSDWIRRHFERLREKDRRALDNAKHQK